VRLLCPNHPEQAIQEKLYVLGGVRSRVRKMPAEEPIQSAGKPFSVSRVPPGFATSVFDAWKSKLRAAVRKKIFRARSIAASRHSIS